jgi:hypothetical protein
MDYTLGFDSSGGLWNYSSWVPVRDPRSPIRDWHSALIGTGASPKANACSVSRLRWKVPRVGRGCDFDRPQR